MDYLQIDERKKLILKEVVQRFILTGDPVGSKVIAESEELKVSPATVRNELAALEKMGLLKQPHTSAGREPTNIAYRFYVDILLGQKRPSHVEIEAAEHLFDARNREIESMFKEASFLLSDLTRTAAMVFAPVEIRHIVHHIDLVPLDRSHIVVIVITSMGQVGKRMMDLEYEIDNLNVRDVSEFLNREISGVEINEIEGQELIEQSELQGRSRKLAASAIEALDSCLDVLEEKIFIGGTSNIVREMDCEGSEWVQRLLEAIEKQDFILDLLKDLVQIRSLTVRIGEENKVRELKKCAFVGTSYPVAEGIFGSLGIVGPTSMDYERSIRIVEYIAENLGRMLYRVM